MDRRELLSAVFGGIGFGSVARLFGGNCANNSPDSSNYIHQITIGSNRAGGPITIEPSGRRNSPDEFVAGTAGTGKTARLEHIIATTAESKGEFKFYDPKGEDQ